MMSHARKTNRLSQEIQTQTSLNRLLLNQLAAGAVPDKAEVTAALTVISQTLDETGATALVPQAQVKTFLNAAQKSAPNATAIMNKAVKIKLFGQNVTFIPVRLN